MHYREPTVFIVGAPKAGTDQLYYDLDQHPAIYMSPLKEPNFFSSEIRVDRFEPELRERMRAETENVRAFLSGDMREKRFGGIVSRWDDYLRLFAGAGPETVIGECSVSYLWSRTAAQAIASRIPHAKIIIILMDPAERAFAQYLKSVSDGSVSHSFGEHLRICFQHTGQTLGIFHPFLEFGRYFEQVQRYMEAFPPEQISISCYDDLRSNYGIWFPRLLEFLGVDPDFAPESGRGHFRPNFPKFVRASQLLQHIGVWKMLGKGIPGGLRPFMKRLAYRNTSRMEMRPEERRILAEYYRNDIQKLARMLNRSLDHWLA